MKANEIKKGRVYAVKVSGRVVPLQVIMWYGGRGYGANLYTGRTIVLNSARRLRAALTPNMVYMLIETVPIVEKYLAENILN